jgi:hypothetical protein
MIWTVVTLSAGTASNPRARPGSTRTRTSRDSAPLPVRRIVVEPSGEEWFQPTRSQRYFAFGDAIVSNMSGLPSIRSRCGYFGPS